MSQETKTDHDITALAHDLKSPLTAIIGFAGLMENQVKGPLPEAYKDYPQLIREGGETLLDRVEQLLEAARNGGRESPPRLQPTDIRASLVQARARFAAQACQTAKDIILLGAREPVMAMADAHLIGRILDNLISNALKYSPRGGKIFLFTEDLPQGVYLGVRDLGVGMRAEDLARIGDRFVQGENAEGRRGTGLGLSIVKRLTQIQSGQLTLRSAPGQGTEVEIILPRVFASGV